MLKKLALPTAILYTIVLTLACLMSLKNVPSLGVSFADKIYHFGAYAVFTTLWSAAFVFNIKLSTKKALIYACGFAIVFGVVIEVLQGTVTAYRSMDVYDIVANSLGALLTTLILWQINKMQVKK